MASKLKVGLIIDSYIVSKQIDHLIQLSLKSDLYDIDCLIIQNIELDSKNLITKIFKYLNKNGLKKFIRSAFFKIIVEFERLIVTKWKSNFNDFFDAFNLEIYNLNSINIKPNISKSGLIYKYDDKELKKIENLNLDLLIRGGSGILRGAILKVCPKGIISFHHADNDINRGGPPAFWEVFYKQKRTGFTIQLLKDELDAGDVIFKGFIPTSFLYTLNYVNLFTKANVFLSKAIESLASDNLKLKAYPKKPYAQPLFKTPTLLYQLRYIVNTSSALCSRLLQKLMHRNFRWGVAYQFVENWNEVALWKSTKIKNPPNHFLADPFIWFKDGKHYCFVEDFDYISGLGSIAAYEITDYGYKELGVVLKESFHLSYPFIIENNGELFMCPGTQKSKDIRLYKCVDFPLKWAFEKILINNVSASDTNIFHDGDKWRLLTNICSSDIGDHNSELHVYSSDELLCDNWKPHPQNPVIFDSLKARNGGMILNKKDVFRVFQRHGWNFYGEAFGVSKITELNDHNYSEEEQYIVEPNFFKGIKGTHSYSYKNGLIAIDFVESVNNKK